MPPLGWRKYPGGEPIKKKKRRKAGSSFSSAPMLWGGGAADNMQTTPTPLIVLGEPPTMAGDALGWVTGPDQVDVGSFGPIAPRNSTSASASGGIAGGRGSGSAKGYASGLDSLTADMGSGYGGGIAGGRGSGSAKGSASGLDSLTADIQKADASVANAAVDALVDDVVSFAASRDTSAANKAVNSLVSSITPSMNKSDAAAVSATLRSLTKAVSASVKRGDSAAVNAAVEDLIGTATSFAASSEPTLRSLTTGASKAQKLDKLWRGLRSADTSLSYGDANTMTYANPLFEDNQEIATQTSSRSLASTRPPKLSGSAKISSLPYASQDFADTVFEQGGSVGGDVTDWFAEPPPKAQNDKPSGNWIPFAMNLGLPLDQYPGHPEGIPAYRPPSALPPIPTISAKKTSASKASLQAALPVSKPSAKTPVKSKDASAAAKRQAQAQVRKELNAVHKQLGFDVAMLDHFKRQTGTKAGVIKNYTRKVKDATAKVEALQQQLQ